MVEQRSRDSGGREMLKFLANQVYGILLCLAFVVAAAAVAQPGNVFRTAIFQGEKQESRPPQDAGKPDELSQPAEKAEQERGKSETERPTRRFSRNVEPTEYQSDWRQAGTDAEKLGERLRSHCVRLVDGALHGRMLVFDPQTGEAVGVRQMTVYLLQRGKPIAMSSLSEDGKFTMTGLSPGVYGLVAAGAGGFAAYSLHLLGEPVPGGQAATAAAVRTVSFLQEEASQLEIETLAIPPADFRALKELIRNYVPDRIAPIDWVEPDRAQIAPGATAFESPKAPGALLAGPDNLYYHSPAELRAEPATSIRRHQVRLQADGSLVGRVRRMHPMSGRPLRPNRIRIFVLQNETIVAHVPVAPNGVFMIKNFSPGICSLAAVARDNYLTGAEGFAAFSVSVLPPRPAAPLAGGQPAVRLASFQVEDELAIDFSLLDYENLPSLRNMAALHLPGGLEAGDTASSSSAGAPGDLAGALGGTGSALGGGGPGGGAGMAGETGYGASAQGGAGGGATGGAGGTAGFGGLGPVAGAAVIGAGTSAASLDDEQLSSPFAL